MQSFKDAVNGFVKDFVVIQINLQIGCQAQFVSHIPHDRLKKRINSFYSEVIVIVKNIGERFTGTFSDFIRVKQYLVLLKFFLQNFYITFG